MSSTDETEYFSPKYDQRMRHTQNKTADFTRNRNMVLKSLIKEKSPKLTDSTSTLVENQNISQSLNNHNLKLSLKSMYNNDPFAKLKQIFKTKYQSPKVSRRNFSKNLSGAFVRRNRSKVDSIFQHNEAELIMNELKTIKCPEVWQKVVQKFKQRPSALMDLIPIE